MPLRKLATLAGPSVENRMTPFGGRVSIQVLDAGKMLEEETGIAIGEDYAVTTMPILGWVLSAGPECKYAKAGNLVMGRPEVPGCFVMVDGQDTFVCQEPDLSATAYKLSQFVTTVHMMNRLRMEEQMAIDLLDSQKPDFIVFDAMHRVVLVEPDPEKLTILLPDGAERPAPLQGTVISAGPECKQIKTGDRVVRASNRRDDIMRWRGRAFVILNEPEIAGILLSGY